MHLLAESTTTNLETPKATNIKTDLQRNPLVVVVYRGFSATTTILENNTKQVLPP